MIWTFFWKKSFIGKKMGVAATLVPKGLRPQDPTKKLAHRVELLGQPLFQCRYLEIVGI